MNDNIITKIRKKEHNLFDSFIFCVIIFSAILIGIETNNELYREFHSVFHLLDILIITIFVFEIIIKMYAEGKKPWRYFYDPWNIFDFIIILISFLPYFLTHSQEDTHALIALRIFRIARAFRVFRVFRLVTHLKPLELIFETLVKSLPSMGFIFLLLVILFYIYAVIGVFLFGKFDPIHFGNIGITFITLFASLTGNWTNTMETIMSQGSFEYYFVPFYFISFYFMGGLIVLNLFVGIIVHQLGEVKIHKEVEIIKAGFRDDLTEEQNKIMSELEIKIKEVNNILKSLQIVLNEQLRPKQRGI